MAFPALLPTPINIGHYLRSVERIKRLVNVHSPSIVSNLKKISKMLMFPPSKIVCGRPWLSPYLFAVSLDDLCNELNTIKAGCYIGEVLLNQLMFAGDICVFCPSVRGLKNIPDVCQSYKESHGITFNCSKTVCMTLKAKSAKSAVTPLLTLHGQNVKSVSYNHNKYLGFVLDTELSDDKDI